MKVAKPDKEMFDAVDGFANACEEMFENGLDGWESWDDDDEDKQLIVKIRAGIAEEESCEPGEVDERLLAFYFLKRKYHNRLKHTFSQQKY